MTLQDFFISGLPTAAAPIEGAKVPLEPQLSTVTDKKPAAAGPSKAPANVDADLETRIDVIIKNPQVILLEDQHNGNSNCLVLDVSISPLLLAQLDAHSSSSSPSKCA